MNRLSGHLRNFYNFTKDFHKGTAFLSAPIGAIVSVNTINPKFYTNVNSNIDSLILTVPEAIIGGIFGYFWMYTLLPYSLYKRYKLNNA